MSEMVNVNSQSDIIVHEWESDLICQPYLELAGSLFPFFLITKTFMSRVPFSSIFRGILWLSIFIIILAIHYCLWLSVEGWLAGLFSSYSLQPKENCMPAFQRGSHGTVSTRELKFFPYPFLVWGYFCAFYLTLLFDTLFLACGFASYYPDP